MFLFNLKYILCQPVKSLLEHRISQVTETRAERQTARHHDVLDRQMKSHNFGD